MSPFGAKNTNVFWLSTPLDGKGVPPFAIPVFYILGKRTFLVYKKLPRIYIFLGSLLFQ